MPEITVNIIRKNWLRSGQYESVVDLFSDGELMIGGVPVTANTPQTDDEIVNLAIEQIYIPMVTPSPEELE